MMNFHLPTGAAALVAAAVMATTCTVSAEEALQAEPQTPRGKFTTATEIKPILSMTKDSWVAVREYDGQDLLYVTHIWSWRCGLLEMNVGINGAAAEKWDLPACHEDDGAPNAIKDEDGLPFHSFALGSVQEIVVEVVYDDLSRESHTFERASVLMP
ncbi:MAG: hypothetical protein ACU0BB_06820 [Paracoccaceae bacterium]